MLLHDEALDDCLDATGNVLVVLVDPGALDAPLERLAVVVHEHRPRLPVHAAELDDILVPTEAHHQLDRHARAEAARSRKDLPRGDPLEQRRFALRLHPDHDNLWQHQIHGAPQLQHDVQDHIRR
eukprot:scaffold2353_cov178-Pinguiococcus_pyrenoidosus.AAC.3